MNDIDTEKLYDLNEVFSDPGGPNFDSNINFQMYLEGIVGDEDQFVAHHRWKPREKDISGAVLLRAPGRTWSVKVRENGFDIVFIRDSTALRLQLVRDFLSGVTTLAFDPKAIDEITETSTGGRDALFHMFYSLTR